MPLAPLGWYIGFFYLRIIHFGRAGLVGWLEKVKIKLTQLPTSNYVEVEAKFGKNILNSCLWFLTVIIDRRDDYLTVIAAWVGNSYQIFMQTEENSPAGVGHQ